nr:hypothetical protein [Pseudomonadota bacterium]
NGNNQPDPNVDQDPNRVTFSDWLRSTNAPTTTDQATAKNHFLAGETSTLDESTTRGYGEGFTNINHDNYNKPPFDGAFIGSDTADNFDFTGRSFFRSDDPNKYYYAWIGSGTDLGAPLTQTSGTLEWNGRFLATDVEEDFTLTITFGEGSKAGKIESFINGGAILVSEFNGGQSINLDSNGVPYYFLLTGEFDTSGVIDGTVARASFTDGDRNAMVAGTNTPGVLSGLIGAEGAIGVFHSNNDGIGLYAYSGGFIVSPNAKPQVRGEDWLNSFVDGSENGLSLDYNQRSETNNEFFFNDTGSSGDLNLENATYNNIALGGSKYNGLNIERKVPIFSNRGDVTTYFITIPVIEQRRDGLNNGGTHLGPVIGETSGTATWRGQFQALHGQTGETDRDFTLNINYSDDSLWAFVERTDTTTPNHYYHIEGNYNEDGVITGTVDRGLFTGGDRNTPTTGTRAPGVLTGIIGQLGAIGGFVSGTTTDGGSTITGGTG